MDHGTAYRLWHSAAAAPLANGCKGHEIVEDNHQMHINRRRHSKKYRNELRQRNGCLCPHHNQTSTTDPFFDAAVRGDAPPDTLLLTLAPIAILQYHDQGTGETWLLQQLTIAGAECWLCKHKQMSILEWIQPCNIHSIGTTHTYYMYWQYVCLYHTPSSTVPCLRSTWTVSTRPNFDARKSVVAPLGNAASTFVIFAPSSSRRRLLEIVLTTPPTKRRP